MWEDPEKTPGKPRKNPGKTPGKPWENPGKTLGKPRENPGKTLRKPRENLGKIPGKPRRGAEGMGGGQGGSEGAQFIFRYWFYRIPFLCATLHCHKLCYNYV